MKRIIVLASVAVALAACQSSETNQQNAQIRAVANQRAAQCQSTKFPTQTAFAQCLNGAEEMLVPLMGNDGDLIQVKMSTRLALAEKVDRRQMSLADANLAWSQTLSNLNTEMQRRNSQARIASAQERSAAANASVANSIRSASSPTYCSGVFCWKAY